MATITLPNEFFELAAEQLRNGVLVRIAVQGDSMYPFLHSGDVIELQPYQGEDLPLYTAVFYQWQGQYMTHRLVRKEVHGDDEVWAMLGDGNIYRYEQVARREIIGVLAHAQRPNSLDDIDCRSRSWLAWGRWWVWLRPIRRFLIPLLKLLKY